MKYTLTLLLTLIAFVAKSQSMKFEIKPYVVNRTVITGDTTFISRSDTSTSIGLTICGIGTDSACVNYILYKQDGSVFEQGTKNTTFQAVGIVIQRPLDLALVNMVLRYWHIEAIRQITDDE